MIHPPTAWAGLALTRPLVMGIINVTPDSFSDGGRHAGADAAIAAGRKMLAEGADILDIGGESTRPGAAPVTPGEEQARILPVIRALAAPARSSRRIRAMPRPWRPHSMPGRESSTMSRP